MAYVPCSDCGNMVHFKPKDVIKFNKRFVEGKEPIYCYPCWQNRKDKNGVEK